MLLIRDTFRRDGFYDKRMFYEESARMPFVIRYPKCIPAGKRVNELVLNVDFASTLCDLPE